MATAHLSVKVGKAGKGTPHAEYISRMGKYAKRLEQGEKLEHTESGNMPRWTQNNPLKFWKAADQYERKNGTVYREHEIALPRELNPEQRAELVRKWVQNELGNHHAYTWAIHNKTALDGGEQPHVHLMFSERMNDGIERDPEQYFKRYNSKFPERGGAKKHRSGETPTERKEALQAMRERWEQLHNAHLEKHGHGKGISMKSLSEQGINRKVEPHMTPSESAALHRKAIADRLAAEVLREYQTESNFRQPEPEKVIQIERHFLEIFNDFKRVSLQINKLSREQENAKAQLEELKDKRETVRLKVWDCHDEYETRKQQKSGLFGLVRNRDDEHDLDKIYNQFNCMKQKYTQLDERVQTAEQDYQHVVQRVSGCLKPLFEQYEAIKQEFKAIPMNDFERATDNVEAIFKQLGKGADYNKMYSKQYTDIHNAGYTGEFAEKLHRSYMVEWGMGEIPKIHEQQQKMLQKQQEISQKSEQLQKRHDDLEIER